MGFGVGLPFMNEIQKLACPKCHKMHGGPVPKGMPIFSEYCEECIKTFTVRYKIEFIDGKEVRTKIE